MANSKHAHYRYNILDYCFSQKSFQINELLDYLNQRIQERYDGETIGERTLRQDLRVFRDSKHGFGAPLPVNARILRYDDPNFSIATKPLLEYEQFLIDAALVLLERFDNHPKYNKLSEALIKFQDEEDQNQLEPILFYDHNEEYKGIKWLKTMYLAIKNKHVLEIVFKGFKDTHEKVFEFHPHVLKQYNRRWFVFGYNALDKNEKWSIPLDERLVSSSILPDAEYIESEGDWQSFFRSMVGVRRESEKIEKVTLKFYNGRQDYFITKPFIADYELFLEEDKVNMVWFETIINKELIQQILSFGKDVEVIEPPALRDSINQIISETKINYEKS